MKRDKTIGYLLIAGAVGVFVPYLVLTLTFNYPGILREATGTILTQFHEGGAPLIFTWLSFALLGLPLLIAYVLIGQKLDGAVSYSRWVTMMGIVSALVQMIGLLRWVFVVPVLAAEYVGAGSASTKEAIEIAFRLVHQFAGVLLGEHLGQLFTITWTVLIAAALRRLKLIPAWLAWFGYTTSAVYLLAQAELLATVIPGFPVVDLAGFAGSTGWLIWLLLVGIRFLKTGAMYTGTPGTAPL